MSEESATMNDLEIFYTIKNYIKKKINNCDNQFFGDVYRAEKTSVYELILRSVEAGESNSAILCGPPGCGKTALVNNVLQELCNAGLLNTDNSALVRLNGLIHTDDTLALQDIARQLKAADTLQEVATTKSFQENLAYILDQLKEKHTSDLCIVIILDEFHLFCEHKNQYLLYNLFDIAQSAKAPICVLGITYYTDVMDLLEKRVLSRFSHRIIQMSKTVTLEDRLAEMRDIFTLVSEDLADIDEIYKFIWNSRTDELLEDKSVLQAIQQHIELDPSEAKFRIMLFKLFNKISFEVPLLTVESVLEVFTSHDAYIQILSRLSVLEMALVIAVKHYTINYEREPFNFEMILTQYMKLVKEQSNTMIRERAVILKAFQRLQELEIVVPLRRGVGSSANTTGKGPLEYQLFTFALMEEQVTEGVKLNKSLPTEFATWATNVETS